MRTYGRQYFPNNVVKWVEITTDPDGNNDSVHITALVQTLMLNLGESPFYANTGIPAQRTILQQLYPDYYVNQTQRQFSQHFASLNIQRQPNTTYPKYNVYATTHLGATITLSNVSLQPGNILDTNFILDQSILG